MVVTRYALSNIHQIQTNVLHTGLLCIKTESLTFVHRLTLSENNQCMFDDSLANHEGATWVPHLQDANQADGNWVYRLSTQGHEKSNKLMNAYSVSLIMPLRVQYSDKGDSTFKQISKIMIRSPSKP